MSQTVVWKILPVLTWPTQMLRHTQASRNSNHLLILSSILAKTRAVAHSWQAVVVSATLLPRVMASTPVWKVSAKPLSVSDLGKFLICLLAGGVYGGMESISSSCNAHNACKSAGYGEDNEVQTSLFDCCNTESECLEIDSATVPASCSTASPTSSPSSSPSQTPTT